MDMISFKEEVLRLIAFQQEGEHWDFKKEWHKNKSDLLHDIICMANNLSNHDGLIIIGVNEETDYATCDITNDPNRRKTQDIVTFLRDKKFAGGVRPTVYVHSCLYCKKVIDVIVFLLLYSEGLAKPSLTLWVDRLKDDRVLASLIGCTQDSLPPPGSYFDFMNRLMAGKNIPFNFEQHLRQFFYHVAVLPSMECGLIPEEHLTVSGDGTAVHTHACPNGHHRGGVPDSLP